jgi:predicted ribosome quality control (RQC) complex YloA/Tae2 family protein
MPFDTLALAAVRDELERSVLGGRIQRLVFPDQLSLALEVYQPSTGRTAVLLSVHPENGRVQRVANLPARGVEHDSPFLLLARKHLRDARVVRLRQPPFERVLELDVEQRLEADHHSKVVLIVEAMGRRGNLLLVGSDGTILDAIRRAPPSRNPSRPILPHLPYTPPPPQDRLSPLALEAGALAEGARGRSGDLARYLLETVAGLSPAASRELAFRAAGSAAAPLRPVDWERVAAAARALFAPLDTHAWTPTVARDAAGEPVDCAAYRLSHLEAAGLRLEPAATMSAALSVVYEGRSRAAQRAPLRAEKGALRAPLERALGQARRRIHSLSAQLEAARAEQVPLRQAGDAILAHQHELEPGARELVVDGQRVALDEHLGAVENAQAYFARYRKARDAAARVPALLAAARQDEAHLAELAALVDVADSMEAIRALRREVAAAVRPGSASDDRASEPGAGATTGGGGRRGTSAAEVGRRGRGGRRSGTVPKGAHQRLPLGAGWEALVGTSAQGNAQVTFDLAGPDDLWLHARGVPGAHVVVRGARPGPAEPPPALLERAAALAAARSGARDAGSVEVDVVPRRHVRKVPNGPPGLVRYSHERTLRVRPEPGP